MIIKLYAPTHDNEGKELDHQSLQKDLLGMRGGFTAYEAVGCWKDSNGVLYKEPVTVYEVVLNTSPTPLKEGVYYTPQERVINSLLRFGREAKQKAVFYTIDNTGHTHAV